LIPFYTELKNIRNKQEIDLSEVANRTKINIKYLEAIESGDFSFLTIVYVRLFLRAYALEIGADPEDALKQLDIHLAKTEDISLPQPITLEEPHKENEDEDLEPARKTPFRIRSDLLKVVILIALVLFAIFVIRKIISEEPAESNVIEQTQPSSLMTNNQASSNYTTQSEIKNLPLEAPYFFLLKAFAPVSYEYSIDESESFSDILSLGEVDSISFLSGFFLRIDQASRIELKINDSLISFNSVPYPVNVDYQSENNVLTVTNFSLP